MSQRTLTAMEAVLGLLCALILAALLAIVLASVVLRYVFHTGVVGVEELCIWLNVALVAFGMPLALNGGLAMRMDLILRNLPVRWRQAGGDVFGTENLRLVPLFINAVGHGVVRDGFGAGLGGFAQVLLGHLAEAAVWAEAHAATTAAGSVLAHINNSFD